MKKILALVLVLATMLSLCACVAYTGKSEGTMTYAEYAAAKVDEQVVIECYVQKTQTWWEKDGKGVITVYAQDHDGGYFIYEMACPSAEEAAKLTEGRKIRVTGTKAEWCGEVEIVDATYELMEGAWKAPAEDVTALIGTDELIKHMNKRVTFKGMVVENAEFKNGDQDDDIYITASKDGVTVNFCVERYMFNLESNAEKREYRNLGRLKAGTVVDIEAFLYWYEGANPHVITATEVEE